MDGRPHVPVMLAEVLDALSPRDEEIFVDGTFGAGGYSQAILTRAPCRVIGIDRDPTAIANSQTLAAANGGRLTLIEGRFGDMRRLLSALGIAHVDGVVLDIGVSSMQLDQAERGFSFLRDGPLDMRMGAEGPTAADLVNGLSQETLGRIIHVFGEEPRARSIARAIVTARSEAPITTTLGLVKAIERVTGRPRPQDRIHPATRTFQALRIQVNSELDELISALHAAEELLQPEGRLVVVTFHSLEDRIVKRFLQSRSTSMPAVSRHLPATGPGPAASFRLPFKGHLSAGAEEGARNPRARSAKLRAGIRTEAPPMPSMAAELSITGGVEAVH
ncbi:MAG: 16S rRNA (cytosine(1402)-N(4))-methyltransferase RsmH [Alphaproteobacteria bacterium]|nr:16S rRNA (cytosine(1402)-N(4))-methyltransferase RsmH [Alphaproteobacteria bacterium]